MVCVVRAKGVVGRGERALGGWAQKSVGCRDLESAVRRTGLSMLEESQKLLLGRKCWGVSRVVYKKVK